MKKKKKKKKKRIKRYEQKKNKKTNLAQTHGTIHLIIAESRFCARCEQDLRAGDLRKGLANGSGE